jgi:carbamate kinase
VRVVVALGGNALLRRGQRLTAGNQRRNARVACRALAPLALEHELVISHGNGPQLGLLALQGAAYAPVESYPLDVLGAQTEGMIGYMLLQELGNELPSEQRLVTLLTLIEVDGADPAFRDPTKPIGPVYTEDEADALSNAKGWVLSREGDGYRRVVPSPSPQTIFGLEPIEWMLDRGCTVICAGGGGIPVMYTDQPAAAGRRLVGVEAVIDKDLANAMLAAELDADALVIATDVDAVYLDWGTSHQRAIRRADPRTFSATSFAEGSMGPKVRAACAFVARTGGIAAIGSIEAAPELLRGTAGTVVAADAPGLELLGAG